MLVLGAILSQLPDSKIDSSDSDIYQSQSLDSCISPPGQEYSQLCQKLDAVDYLVDVKLI